jgi:transposase
MKATHEIHGGGRSRKRESRIGKREKMCPHCGGHMPTTQIDEGNG